MSNLKKWCIVKIVFNISFIASFILLATEIGLYKSCLIASLIVCHNAIVATAKFIDELENDIDG